ncbi:MAG: type II toxin-antitoxin system Phd/YefM family antitoxin [bacterium]|nr:type II toxin-antitoxin system Phd/YefM family antitoxin [bacterium]
MSTVTTRILKDQLSAYLHRAEGGERFVVLRGGRPVAALVSLGDVKERDEATRLAALEARGLVIRPREESRRKPFSGPTVPARGKLASEMAIEDRR